MEAEQGGVVAESEGVMAQQRGVSAQHRGVVAHSKVQWLSREVPSSRLISSPFLEKILFFSNLSEGDPLIFSGRKLSKVGV